MCEAPEIFLRLHARPKPLSVREAMKRARKKRERLEQDHRSELSLLLSALRLRSSGSGVVEALPATSSTLVRKISDHIAKMDRRARLGKGSPFDPNARTMDGTTFFLSAVQGVCREEHKKLLQMMLDRGADVNLYGIRTTLKDRVEKDDRHTIYRELNEDYANMHNAHTPLLAALYKFKALRLDRPAVGSAATATVAAATMAAAAAAAEKSHSEEQRVAKTFVEMLLAAGADPNLVAPYIKGVPPLIVAVQATVGLQFDSSQRRVENLKRSALLIGSLLRAGADPNGRDDDGRTALMHSVIQPRIRTLAASESDLIGVAVIEVLMRSGANPNLYSYCGETALTMAIDKDNVAATRALLEWGACTKAKEVEHTAIRELQRRVAEHLGSHSGTGRRTAYDLARNYGPYGGPDYPHVIMPVWLAQTRADAWQAWPSEPHTERLLISQKIRSLVRSRHHWRRARIKFKVRQLVIFWWSSVIEPDKMDMDQDLASATEGIEGAVGGLGA
tara:strand:- start:374 stop:1885 length:1512 start_codon:yes stop_codon:yes gene_type:complete